MIPAPTSPLLDKRKHPRVIVHLPAIYRSSGTTVDGYVANLSQGGAFITCATFDAPGTTAELMIMVPGLSAPIKVPARVVWVHRMHPRQGMGVSFSAMDREQRLALANVLIARYYNR